MQDTIAAPADTVPVPAAASSETRCTLAQYNEMYSRSLDAPDAFWAEQAERLDWFRAPTNVANWSYDPVDIRWFEDGQLNICHNAVDRHVEAGRGDVTALIFEPDDPAGEVRRLTYAGLQVEVIRMANTLKKMGVARGDRVTIYMPM
ncbi:MAG: AMP-binding protein, partial [Novosphingobium sp.]|nr:AMP-binding protein [Novosphingobium sp.]